MLVYGYPFMQMDDAFGSWRFIAERAVRAFSVVVVPPFFDDNLGLFQRIEDLSIEKLVAKARVEALDVSVPTIALEDFRLTSNLPSRYTS